MLDHSFALVLAVQRDMQYHDLDALTAYFRVNSTKPPSSHQDVILMQSNQPQPLVKLLATLYRLKQASRY
jgi:hypothetical protein